MRLLKFKLCSNNGARETNTLVACQENQDCFCMFHIEMKRTIIQMDFFPFRIAQINHTCNVCKKTYNFGKFDSPLGAALRSFFAAQKLKSSCQFGSRLISFSWALNDVILFMSLYPTQNCLVVHGALFVT